MIRELMNSKISSYSRLPLFADRHADQLLGVGGRHGRTARGERGERAAVGIGAHPISSIVFPVGLCPALPRAFAALSSSPRKKHLRLPVQPKLDDVEGRGRWAKQPFPLGRWGEGRKVKQQMSNLRADQPRTGSTQRRVPPCRPCRPRPQGLAAVFALVQHCSGSLQIRLKLGLPTINPRP